MSEKKKKSKDDEDEEEYKKKKNKKKSASKDDDEDAEESAESSSKASKKKAGKASKKKPKDSEDADDDDESEHNEEEKPKKGDSDKKHSKGDVSKEGGAESSSQKDLLPYTIRSIRSQLITPEHVKKELMCFICAKPYKENDHFKMLACCHFFHSECIGRWMRMNAFCPQCKRPIEGKPPDGMPLKADYFEPRNHSACSVDPDTYYSSDLYCNQASLGSPKQTFIIINQSTNPDCCPD